MMNDQDIILVCIKRKMNAKEKSSSSWKVLTNSVILRKLVNYLNFQDVKALRLSCSDINQAILNETSFRRRALVKITADNGTEQGFGATRETWLHFDIDAKVGCQVDLPPEFYAKLQLAKSIKLSNNVNPLKNVAQYNLYLPHIQRILEAPDKLESLAVHSSVVSRSTGKKSRPARYAVFPPTESQLSERFLKNWTNLMEFQIFGGNTESTLTVWTTPVILPRQPMTKLQGFHLRTDGTAYSMTNVRNLLEFTQTSQKTLRSLSLCIRTDWSGGAENKNNLPLLFVLNETKFPLLTSLSLLLSDENEKIKKAAIKFLQNHPHLTELSLKLESTCDDDLWSVIQRRSQTLKVLRLAFRGFQTFGCNRMDFLTSAKSLEEFSIRNCSTNWRSTHGNEIIKKLPRSIRRIFLVEIPHGALNKTYFANIEMEKITHLDLRSELGFSIDDKSMEFICSNLKGLQYLNLKNNSDITDFGTTGRARVTRKRGRDSKHWFETDSDSIANLKSLKELILDKCGRLTFDTLLYGVKCPELQHLGWVDNKYKITSEVLSVLLQNNPSLETIEIQSPHRKWVGLGLPFYGEQLDILVAETFQDTKRICIHTNKQIMKRFPRFRGFKSFTSVA